MTLPFSARMREETADLLERILALPFNRELADGSLETARFQNYVIQDALYLLEYGRVLARVAASAPDADTIALFAKSAEGAILVERALHASYFERFGITAEQVAAAEPSPACQAYTDFLQASVARDGVEALDYIFCRGAFEGRNSGHPAVVLLDLKLPKVDGIEVLEQVKNHPRFRAIPIVMLTSSREESDIVRSYQQGVNSFVVKPVSFTAFFEAIRDLGVFWAVLNEPVPGDL